jgi:hypothetical protein
MSHARIGSLSGRNRSTHSTCRAQSPFGAVAGVLNTVLGMIAKGAARLGVATEHVIESFRNELWAGYKSYIARVTE